VCTDCIQRLTSVYSNLSVPEVALGLEPQTVAWAKEELLEIADLHTLHPSNPHFVSGSQLERDLWGLLNKLSNGLWPKGGG